MRAVRKIHRELVTAGKSENPLQVIGMLMCHYDRGQLIGGSAQPGQSGCRHACRKAAVEQHFRLAGIDNQGVTLTAATQRRETDHFNWS